MYRSMCVCMQAAVSTYMYSVCRIDMELYVVSIACSGTALAVCEALMRRIPLYWGLRTTWTSKRTQNNGPISQNREYSQYRVHYLGPFGGPGRGKILIRNPCGT